MPPDASSRLVHRKANMYTTVSSDMGLIGHSCKHSWGQHTIVLHASVQGVLNTYMLLNEYLDYYPLLLLCPGNIWISPQALFCLSTPPPPQPACNPVFFCRETPQCAQRCIITLKLINCNTPMAAIASAPVRFPLLSGHPLFLQVAEVAVLDAAELKWLLSQSCVRGVCASN